MANEIITLYHELQHARQICMVRNGISSKEILQYAREFALLELANQNESLSNLGEYYEKNHDNFLIENNANSTSIAMFLEAVKNKEFMEAAYISEKVKNQNTNIAYSLNPEIQDIVDDKIEPYIDANLLTIYPALQKEYNMDGTRKSSKQLVSVLLAERDEISASKDLDETEKSTLTNDCNEMYYELIYKALKKENPSFEDLESLNEIYGNDNLISDIQQYFEERILQIQTSEQYLSVEKQTQIISYYENKLDSLSEIGTEWSFGLTEEEKKENKKLVERLQSRGNDYNKPNGRPKKFQYVQGKEIKFNITDIKKAFGISNITLPEYKEGVTELKKQVLEHERGDRQVVEHKRNGEQAR